MSLLKIFLAPVGYMVGTLISKNKWILEIYRSKNFKGKLFLSSFIDKNNFKNGIYKCGGLKYNIDFKDKIQEMVYLGIYEKNELDFLKQYVKKDWICLDIGANIGFYTLNLSQLISKYGKVYAIEPSPENYKKLQDNISINKLENVVASNIALSSVTGKLNFSTSPDRNSGLGRIGKWKAAKSEVIVDTKTLDEFVREHGIAKIDFLKIDIEGHELEFLKGAKRSLQSGLVDRIMIEYCGYILEAKNLSLRYYVNCIEKFGYTATKFNLSKINKAKSNTYKPRKEILNLLFEKN